MDPAAPQVLPVDPVALQVLPVDPVAQQVKIFLMLNIQVLDLNLQIQI